MMHIGHLLGVIAGFVGISIAIYLQLIAKRRCDWRYVVGFYVIGVSTLIGNIEAFGVPGEITVTAMTVGYAVIIVFELLAAYWVYQHSEIEPPSELIRQVTTEIKR